MKVNTIRLVFLLGLFLLPFIFWPWAEIYYEVPRVWFFIRWVETLGVLGVLGTLGRLGKLGKEGNRSLIYGVLFFWALAVLSSVLGVNFEKSLIGNYFRFDGLFTLFHLVGLFFFLNLFWEKSWEKPTFKTLAAGSILISFWTVFLGVLGTLGISAWLGDLSKWGGSVFGNAIGGTFGNPNFLAGYLVVTLPFTYHFLKEKGKIGLIGLIGQMGAIFLTRSAGGILGIILFVFGLIFLVNKKKNLISDKKTIWFLGIGVSLIFGLFVLYFGSNLFRNRASQFDFFPQSRTRIFTKGILAFTKKPLFGWGVANFDYAFESVDWPLKVENDVYVDRAHSVMLEILVTMGIAGLIGYLLFIGIILKSFLGGEASSEKRILFLALLLYFIHSQTNIISINEEMIFWLIAGITARQPLLSKQKNGKI